eukprot:CAMPEP_0117684112 /NCGR_PEP_ID=MMETSP0804-20121206/20876_1 /TAXON_ID=1074897 /ORGANISM="Tetraselmis astigmatica, Strain CCMP880" /LENGTH=206 /DNA_ID=CAMNT_0005494983 /DNA_START=89 /DNA_END=709 /DNA_ORIENTATION=+
MISTARCTVSRQQPVARACRGSATHSRLHARSPTAFAPALATQSKPQTRRPCRSMSVSAQASDGKTEMATKWPEMWRALNDLQLDSLPPSEAMRMVTAGEAVLVDVRLKEDFEKCHALESTNVPLFKRVDLFNTDMKGVFRFFVYGMNGVSAVEPSTTFSDDLAEVVGDKAVIFYCEAGGTIEPTPNFLWGRESRSLRAAYKVRGP